MTGLSRSRFSHLKNVNKIFTTSSPGHKNLRWHQQSQHLHQMNHGDTNVPLLAEMMCPNTAAVNSPRPALAMQHCHQHLCSAFMPRVDVGAGWLVRSLSPAQNGRTDRSKIILLVWPWFCQFYESAVLNNYLFSLCWNPRGKHTIFF